MLVLTALGISIFNTFLYIGAHTTTAINIVMLQTAMPIVVVIATFLIFRETLTGSQAAGIAASFLGTLTLISHGDPAILLHLDFKRGDLWMLAAVVSYAVYTALLRLRPPVHGLSFVFATFALGATLLLPFYVAESAWVAPMPVSLHSVAAIGYVAVFASILAYLAFNRTVELVGANTAGLTVHLVPVFGTILAVLLLGEQVHTYHGVGIALIGSRPLARDPQSPCDWANIAVVHSGHPPKSVMAAKAAIHRQAQRSRCVLVAQRRRKRRSPPSKSGGVSWMAAFAADDVRGNGAGRIGLDRRIAKPRRYRSAASCRATPRPARALDARACRAPVFPHRALRCSRSS